MGNNGSHYSSASESSYSSCSWANPFCSQTSQSYSFEGDGTGNHPGTFTYGTITGPMAVILGSVCAIILVMAMLIHVIYSRRKILRAHSSILDCNYADFEQGKRQIGAGKAAYTEEEDLSPKSKVDSYKYNLKRLFSIKAMVPVAPGGGPAPERRLTLTNLNNLCLAPRAHARAQPNAYAVMNAGAGVELSEVKVKP